MEESANEARRVEVATSPPSVGSPPRSRAHREVARVKEEAADQVRRAAAEKAASIEEAGQSAAEKAVAAGEMQMPPASPPSPPQGSPGRELLPAGRDQALPGDDPVEQLMAGHEEAARMAEELLAAARRATESAEVSCHPPAV